MFLSLGLAAGAMGIRVEPEVQVVGEVSEAPPVVARAKATRMRVIVLPAPAIDIVPKADHAPKTGVPLQIGSHREVPELQEQAGASLDWEEQPDGTRVGAVSITSPGAAALRVAIRVVAIPAEATFRFYGPDGAPPFEVKGSAILDTIARNVASGDTTEAARTYWSPVIEAQTLVMEIELPAGAQASDLDIGVPRISHLVTSMRTGFIMPKAASACEIDAMCSTGWSPEMNSVARMIFSEGAGSYLCTGTLLTDQDPSTTIPYFLSANHCISTQTVASTLTTYWFYRSTSCNSGTLVLPGVYQPLATGATLLYASAATDTSFMRLNSAPPAGAVYAGWLVASTPPASSTVTAIHHPAGSYLRISYGSITGFSTCGDAGGGTFSCTPTSLSPSGTFYQIRFTSGQTEGGSSGSGIFLNSGKYLIGQLYGGSGSCPTSSADRDYYGRLDVAYNAAGGLSTWLGPPARHALTLTPAGAGAGTVTSAPAGINCGATCTASFTQGTPVALTATPASGSVFSGWSGACSGSGACNVTMNAAASVTATFVPSLYTLTLTRSGTGSGTAMSGPEGIHCGATCSASFAHGTVVNLAAAPHAGSAFTRWSNSCSGSGGCTLTMSSNLTVNASFDATTLSVARGGSGTGTVTSAPTGIDCGTSCSAGFVQGAAVTLTASPAAGSVFTGWGGPCTGTGACVVNVNAATGVSATFASNTAPAPGPTIALTFTTSGAGTGTVASAPDGLICAANCIVAFPQNSVVTLVATPHGGSFFAGWTGACSGMGSCTVTLNAAAAVVATFTTTPPVLGSPSLTIVKGGGGSGAVASTPGGYYCGTVCSGGVPAGTAITLTATPDVGSTFAGWSGACGGTGTCSLTINSPLSVTATFN